MSKEVLLAHSSEIILPFLAEPFEAKGIEVSTASTLEKAQTLFREEPDKYGLLVVNPYIRSRQAVNPARKGGRQFIETVLKVQGDRPLGERTPFTPLTDYRRRLDESRADLEGKLPIWLPSEYMFRKEDLLEWLAENLHALREAGL